MNIVDKQDAVTVVYRLPENTDLTTDQYREFMQAMEVEVRERTNFAGVVKLVPHYRKKDAYGAPELSKEGGYFVLPLGSVVTAELGDEETEMVTAVEAFEKDDAWADRAEFLLEKLEVAETTNARVVLLRVRSEDPTRGQRTFSLPQLSKLTK